MATLRDEMERRQQSGGHFSLKQVVALMVPLISEVALRHEEGATLFVYPGCVQFIPGGCRLDEVAATEPPKHPRDRACLAPEQRAQEARGDARASVFAIGAILYELVTAGVVGPGMRRPSDVVRTLPANFETLLGKALVADREHRPADLAALAQALHNMAPTASIPPPAADESHLDGDDSFEVDVSLSLIPPKSQMEALQQYIGRPVPAGGQPGPLPLPAVSQPGAPIPAVSQPGVVDRVSSPDGRASQAGAVPSSGGSTTRLAQLKAQLEADPRPRYVVIKDGMDHGPFSAVELLQQIASGSFKDELPLRDSLTKDERPIGEWEQFAPFAEHAKLGREKKQERKDLEKSAEAEQQTGRVKLAVGAAVAFLALCGAAGWWFRASARGEDPLAIFGDRGQSVEVDGGLAGGKKGGPTVGGGRWTGGRTSGGDGDEPPPVSAGSHPQLGGGQSCEAARAAYIERYEEGVPPDLTAGSYGAVLNRGTYLNSCGVPPDMGVTICAAVQNGRAVGVTVRTDPPNGGIAGCIRGQISSMSFPSHPRLDVSTTTFKKQP